MVDATTVDRVHNVRHLRCRRSLLPLRAADRHREVHLDRKLERMLTMLLRLKELRRTTVEG